MNILSRYELSIATYELSYLEDNDILNIINSLDAGNPVLKAVKILSLSLIDMKKTKNQIKNYFDTFAKQILSLQNYEYTEEEIEYLVYFIISKNTTFVIEESNKIKELFLINEYVTESDFITDKSAKAPSERLFQRSF